MAAVSSVWAKPGSWALDSEEHDSAAADFNPVGAPESSANTAEFPSLAAATKAPKKKKGQTISLAEFTTGHAVTHGAARSHTSSSKGLTQDELINLPTGPRERTVEELERDPRGFRYSYGGDRGAREDSSSRWGSSRVSDEGRRPDRDLGGPSRADEVDDWGAGKKTAFAPERRGGGGFFDSHNRADSFISRADDIDDWGTAKKTMVPERRDERRERGGGFFDSQSRADGPDSWVSNKHTVPMPAPSEGRRSNGFIKEATLGSGADSDTWGRRRDEPIGDGRADSDSWGKKREVSSGGGRPRLVLQPRSVQPLSNGSNGEVATAKTMGSNPFGAARPREEVLAEKGEDWKKIDEKLESVRIRDVPPERKGFGMGYGAGGHSDDRVGKSWRKAIDGDAISTLPPDGDAIFTLPPDGDANSTLPSESVDIAASAASEI